MAHSQTFLDPESFLEEVFLPELNDEDYGKTKNRQIHSGQPVWVSKNREAADPDIWLFVSRKMQYTHIRYAKQSKQARIYHYDKEAGTDAPDETHEPMPLMDAIAIVKQKAGLTF